MAGVTPSGRLLFWLRISFLGDVALAAIGGVLIAQGDPVGDAVLVFVALRAALGVAALLIASRIIGDTGEPGSRAGSTPGTGSGARPRDSDTIGD